VAISDRVNNGPRRVEARLPRRGHEDDARTWEELATYRVQFQPLGMWTDAMEDQWTALNARAQAGDLFDRVIIHGLPPAQLEGVASRFVGADGNADWAAMLPDLMAVSAEDPDWRDAGAWRTAISDGSIDSGMVHTLRSAIEKANSNAGGLAPLDG